MRNFVSICTGADWGVKPKRKPSAAQIAMPPATTTAAHGVGLALDIYRAQVHGRARIAELQSKLREPTLEMTAGEVDALREELKGLIRRCRMPLA